LDEITELEKKWIRETGSYIDGYNLTGGNKI
jgi:hypothetical protein